MTEHWFTSPLTFAGHWEPLAFRRRRGGQRSDEAERYAREHSDEAIRAMKDAGINFVITHFDKGFGPESLATDLPLLRDWVSRLHANAIRVGAYIRYDNLVPEAFPQSKAWLSQTSFGDSSAILWQSYRRSACPSNKDHHAHIESLIHTAIHDLKVDLIHMDGFWMGNEAWACHCDRCIASFQDYLASHYPTPDSAIERFGHTDTSLIRPPVYRLPDNNLSIMEPVKDPAAQEWMEWRTETLAALARRFRETIRAQNPEVVFEVNSLIPIGYNNAFYWGFELPKLVPHVQAFWTEDDHWAGWREDGVLVSRLREFKIGRTLGAKVFSYQRDRNEKDLVLSLLQSAAFNRGDLGMIGSPLIAEEPLYETKRAFTQWYARHQHRFASVAQSVSSASQSAADVALWRSQHTLGCNSTSAHRSVILAEQALIQGKISFDIIYDDNLKDLSRYRVLVLPNVEMLDAEQVELISQFVRNGGGLVATELTSLYDEWRRLRPDFALRDLFGANALLDLGDNWQKPTTSAKYNASYVQNLVGSGRVAYVPTIQTRRAADYTGVIGEEPYRFGTEQWENPLNAADLLKAIRWSAGGLLTAEVDAPEGVAVELLTLPSPDGRGAGGEGTLLLHLLNYKLDTPVPEAKIRLRLPVGKKVTRASLLTYPADSEIEIPFTQTGVTLKATIPAFECYALLIIE
ncbi:MAG: alpha-amylase family protein [Chloroflexota bacterium]